MNIKKWSWVLSILMTLFFLSCTDNEPNEGIQRETEPPAPHTLARFNPASGNPADIPLPNDILRNPLTGQLAVPGAETMPPIAMNYLLITHASLPLSKVQYPK